MTEIQKLEMQIFELGQKLNALRKEAPPTPVKNYKFKTLTGETTLLDLFGDKDTLFMIHNMGQGCNFCTLWADGLNGFLPHLESKYAVALASKDAPDVQRKFANDRGWRYTMVSHGGGEYLKEQTVVPGEHINQPGMVCYTRKGDQIFKKNQAEFGPGDQFCSLWNIISLAGHGEAEWIPQYSYWKKPTENQ
jgi:predicted dithiol-disulfide oxidoreductase (DUF899 family)